MSDYSDDDISWLTQEPSVEGQDSVYQCVNRYIEEDIPLDNGQNIVSLEEGTSSQHVLYDNVFAEDISSDECVDTL